MKKQNCLFSRIGIFVWIILFTSTLLPSAVHAEVPELPIGSAHRAVLMEVTDGQILQGLGENLPVDSAAVSGYLAALTAFEQGDLSDTVTIPDDLLSVVPDDAARIYLEVGEVLSLRDLIGVLLFSSANDAAYALAVHIAGDPESFCRLMNETALKYGASDTQLDSIFDTEGNGQSTLCDMARICRALWQNEYFQSLLRADLFSISPTNLQPETRYFVNPLDMRGSGTERYYEYALGGRFDGNVIIGFSQGPDMTLITILSGETDEDSAYSDIRSLMRYGYEYYQPVTIAFPGNSIARLPIEKDGYRVGYADIAIETELTYIAEVFSIKPSDPEGLASHFSHTADLPEYLSLPLKKGDIVGRAVYTKIDDPSLQIELDCVISMITVSDEEALPDPTEEPASGNEAVRWISIGLAVTAVLLILRIFLPVILKKLHEPKPY